MNQIIYTENEFTSLNYIILILLIIIVLETIALLYFCFCKSRSFKEIIEIIDSEFFEKLEKPQKIEIYKEAILKNPELNKKLASNEEKSKKIEYIEITANYFAEI